MTEFLSKFSFKDGEYSYFNLEEAVSYLWRRYQENPLHYSYIT